MLEHLINGGTRFPGTTQIRARFEELKARLAELEPLALPVLVDQLFPDDDENLETLRGAALVTFDGQEVANLNAQVQGVLYLTDTAANQGAFRCVPGFHRRIETWLKSLPSGADPRREDLEKFGAVPIAGRAGDLIIWHQA